MAGTDSTASTARGALVSAPKACAFAAAAGAAIASLWWALPPSSRASAADAGRAIADLQATVAQLQQRIVRLQDTDQIENLISIYGYYLDKRQWDQLADLFADDGSMEISLRGIYVGKKSIRKALELFGPLYISTDYLHNHIQLQPVIRLSADGTHAWSRSRALSELATFERVGVWGDGIYANEYVKRNGVWMIEKDHVYTTFFATYDRGWQYAVSGAPRESKQIPPDRPPSVLYDSYPGEFIPPFDYDHPVTGAPIEIPPDLQVKPNPGARQAHAAAGSPDAEAGPSSEGARQPGSGAHP